jgi:hypothetical protein
MTIVVRARWGREAASKPNPCAVLLILTTLLGEVWETVGRLGDINRA